MKFEITILIAFLASGPPLCSAWGNMGHEAVAYIATNFVTTPTKTYFQNILGDTTTDYLAAVATYADTYRYTTAGLYSKPYHFIDANDSPPSSCSVEYSRDCGSEGCVVSAIKNYTSRVQSGTLSAANVAQAAKFVGDIHQPLHDENLDVGGNDITVTFDGTSTNLHHIWDTNMPEKYAGGSTIAVAKTFAATLTTAIKTGKYESDKAGWLTGIDITDPVSTAMVWASDANSFVCSTVMPNGVSAVEGVDLGGAYYTAAIPIVEEQIAKAGYRLAAWLNLIATGSTGL
ncbi:S1/P1 nuclease [Hyaloscypha bicolor E]|uniref:S1/P1 nuclease n=1 Tax=Hyaloscypha bicolor E TaxID=1095630 RepID=A0A2J6THC2_9HELO|nr:S1/P1 nuclease [Hyaloscypha bicolor E]PMD62413.1 S1/P1 nuclease [Hyaloscypha bicolor E]